MLAKERRCVDSVDDDTLRAALVILDVHCQISEHLSNFFLVFDIYALLNCKIRSRAIHSTRVEINDSEVFCHGFCDCAFSCSGRTVYCDVYHIPSDLKSVKSFVFY